MKSVSELNKRKVRLFVEAVLNEGRLDLIDELVAADYMGHFPCAGTGGAPDQMACASSCPATAAPIPACTSRSKIRSPRTTAS